MNGFRQVTAALVAGSFCIIVACSGGGDGASACKAAPDDATCRSDGDCCSNNCVLQGTNAYCRPKGFGAASCASGGDPCTQNRHCCDGLCEKDVCFGSAGQPTGPSCLPNGAECTDNNVCCSMTCGPGSPRKCLAAAGGTHGDGGACIPGGGACSSTLDCCNGVCFPSPIAGGSICSSGQPGGPSGGNCIASGNPCTVASECCSRTCTPRAGGGTYCG